MVSKPLSKERMGEIALKVLKYRLEREGIKLTPNFRLFGTFNRIRTIPLVLFFNQRAYQFN
jgi:hypothetical protein